MVTIYKKKKKSRCPTFLDNTLCFVLSMKMTTKFVKLFKKRYVFFNWSLCLQIFPLQICLEHIPDDNCSWLWLKKKNSVGVPLGCVLGTLNIQIIRSLSAFFSPLSCESHSHKSTTEGSVSTRCGWKIAPGECVVWFSPQTREEAGNIKRLQLVKTRGSDVSIV